MKFMNNDGLRKIGPTPSKSPGPDLRGGLGCYPYTYFTFFTILNVSLSACRK